MSMSLILAALVITVSLSGQSLDNPLLTECHDASMYAYEAAQAYREGRPWIEVWEKYQRYVRSDTDLGWLANGLILGYKGLTPDQAAQIAFDQCFQH